MAKRRATFPMTTVEQPKISAAAAPSSNERALTVQQWARGRADAVTQAFVGEQTRGRVVKHTPSEWMKLYRDFISKPRG